MAEKLSIQIALEGGKEIEQQLESLGATGKKAFGEIARAAEDVGGFDKLKPEVVTQKLEELGVKGPDAINKINAALQQATELEKVAMGVKSIEDAFAKLGIVGPDAVNKILNVLKELGLLETLAPKISGLIATIIKIGPALAAIGTAATAAFAAIQSAIAEIQKINAAAIKAGLSFQQFAKAQEHLQKIGLSAEQATGAVSSMASALDKIQVQRIQQLAATLKEAADAGLAVRGGSQIIDELVEKAKGIGPVADAARTALQGLGIAVPETVAERIGRIAIEAEKVGGKGAAFAAITAEIQKIPDATQRSALAIQFLGTEAGVAFEQVTQGITPMQRLLEQLGVSFEELPSKISVLEKALEFIKTDGAASFDAVKTATEQATTATQNYASSLSGLSWENISSAGVSAWEAITTAIGNALSKLAEFLGLQSRGRGSGGGGGEPASGLARGGMIRGRGTGTSDSNLAWLSRGEYVTPARAVQQPGVLAFLEALRRSGGNLRRVLDGMGRFALGGLVPRPMPAFAAGGLAGGMSNVTIQFPGLPAIGGLRASADVVDELRKAAAMAQVRSGGRKPSRYT